MNSIFPIRLKQARVMKGLSMDALCERTGNALSKQSISKYESGKMMPDSKSLIALANALEVSIDYLLRPLTVSIDNIEFRKKARLNVKQIASIREIVKDRVERYFEIEAINGSIPEFGWDYSNVIVLNEDDVYVIAERVKTEWKLGEDGINNLIEILEENNIKVVEIDAPKYFDGLSGFVNEKNPIIVLNKNFDVERKRFTALHELGHLLLKFNDAVNEKQIEMFCNLFANEMLISKNVFLQKIGEKRHDISLQELKELQLQFGISIDALMYKARMLNVITETRFQTFHRKKNALPAFKQSVEKSRSKDECSNRFVRLVYRALASETISISKASVLLDCPIDKVRNRLSLV